MVRHMDECLVHYQRLLALLEEDLLEIGQCIRGELLEEYRRIVQEEMDQVREQMELYRKNH